MNKWIYRVSQAQIQSQALTKDMVHHQINNLKLPLRHNKTMPSSSPNELGTIIHQLEQNISQENHKTSVSLLSKAKLALLHANGLAPNPASKPELLVAGQHVLELGALTSIRLRDPLAFTRYFQQLQPFYSLPNTQSHKQSQRSKVTGLYLLLLLSQGDYAGFHTQLESLEMAAGQSGARGLEDDEFVQYPMRLEQWLMEGSYDRVWEETKSERVPSEEFAMFSEVR